jgi:hypothetical protein
MHSELKTNAQDKYIVVYSPLSSSCPVLGQLRPVTNIKIQNPSIVSEVYPKFFFFLTVDILSYIFIILLDHMEHAAAKLVEVPCYMPEGHGLNSR